MANQSGQILPPVPPSGVDGKWMNTLRDSVNIAYSSAYPTAGRPSTPFIGQHTFDVTLGVPIWCKSLNPVVWVNASGTAV